MPKSTFTPAYNQFRLLLITARKTCGLTQVDLAAKLQKPQSYVSKFERGERRLDIIEFLKVAEALDMDPIKFIKKLNSGGQN
jgi:transcriptional regulator with XRE-family HTH domain